MADRRIKIFYITVLVILILLGMRMYQIQIIGGEELANAALRQQQVRLTGIDGRGTICDRNMVPLTGSTKEYIYIAGKERIDAYESDLEKEHFYEIIQELNGDVRSREGDPYVMFASTVYSRALAEELTERYGAFIFETARRYEDAQSAAHIIGYINTYDNRGISGIEYELDSLLSLARNDVYAFADRNSNIIPGTLLRKASKNTDGRIENDIVLTIDIKLQKICEQALLEEEQNGAVVILDTKSAEILSIASTPMYNPNTVSTYIDSRGSELVNKCTQGEYPPGSVFKIIVAAAAIENKIADADGNPVSDESIFVCDGKEELMGIEIGCSTGGEEGHGEITLEEAFAYSCNCAFIQLGKLIGGDAIIDMAEKFGFGEVPFTDISNVKDGNLTKKEDALGDGIGNLSIGQGSMLCTPLQIARMTNIIACKGIDTEISLVKNYEELALAAAEIEGSRDIAYKYTNRKVRADVISQETAEMITDMMRAAAEYGTARGIDEETETAGKTGSAEDTAYGSEVVHGWFTGFFPASDPRYTITVFIENGRSGRAAAIPVFKKIVSEINLLYD